MGPKVDPTFTSLKAVLPDKLHKGQSASRFFKRFERVCTCLEWTDDAKKAAQVMLLFGDDIFDFADTLDDTTTASYTALKKKVVQYVDGGELAEAYVRQFQTMKLQPGEDITVFMGKMKEVGRKAYTDMDDTVFDSMLMQQFIMAMPLEVRKCVYLSTETNPTPTTLLESCRLFLQVNRPVELGACAVDTI